MHVLLPTIFNPCVPIESSKKLTEKILQKYVLFGVLEQIPLLVTLVGIAGSWLSTCSLAMAGDSWQ